MCREKEKLFLDKIYFLMEMQHLIKVILHSPFSSPGYRCVKIQLSGKLPDNYMDLSINIESYCYSSKEGGS